jgi:hypothetical protein
MSCSWPVDRTCLPIVTDEVGIAQQTAAENLAVQVLWALSGRQFGVCPVTVRPCPQSCGPYTWDQTALLAFWDGANWRNTFCGCGPKCSWLSPYVVHLGVGAALPVQEIIEVVIDGVVLLDTEYRLEGDLLYRIGAKWPSQNLAAPLDEPGTWSITYTRGFPPPEGTANLVGLLAKEFLTACAGGKCALPRRVQTVSRQGVTYQMVDPTDIYTTGKTGISEIDLWLSAVNPRAMASPPTVR